MKHFEKQAIDYADKKERRGSTAWKCLKYGYQKGYSDAVKEAPSVFDVTFIQRIVDTTTTKEAKRLVEKELKILRDHTNNS